MEPQSKYRVGMGGCDIDRVLLWQKRKPARIKGASRVGLKTIASSRVLHEGRFILDSAGNPDNSDVIEVVSIHGFCSPAKVFASVLPCVVIPS